MANLRNKNENNQQPSPDCSFILLQFQYDEQLILPIDEGTQILRLLGKARTLVKAYGKNPKLKPCAPTVQVEYMTAAQLKEFELNAMIAPDADT